MICPKCGTEYRDGFTECAYCHIPLVESLGEGVDPDELLRRSEGKEEAVPEAATPEEFMRIAREKGLSERDIAMALSELAQEKMPVPSEEETGEEPQDTMAYRNVYPETLESPVEAERAAVSLKPYRKASDRVEDLRSSAYTLIIVGVLGIIAVILLYIGALPITLSGPGKFVTTGTMGAIFILFFIIGVKSYSKLNLLNEEAKREEKKIEEIRKFFFDSYDAESLDREALVDDETNAGEYFLRSSFMKRTLNERFMDLDPSFLEYIVDSFYSELYDEN